MSKSEEHTGRIKGWQTKIADELTLMGEDGHLSDFQVSRDVGAFRYYLSEFEESLKKAEN